MKRKKTAARKVRRLRQLRRERELTQARLGALVGLSTQSISSLESGETSTPVEKAIEIASVFGRPVEEVFALIEVPA